ncbi:MAG: 50S ribosomal protein L32 [Candidatus Riesia sp.]|nr:50S ribosomal protein L32 [Candidatus Riesia sp.]
MAVQKSKKSRSKRDSKRNAKVKFKLPSLTKDSESGELHLRHFISESGYYRGRQILDRSKNKKTKSKPE